MRHSVLDRLQRIALFIIAITLLGIALLGAQVTGVGWSEPASQSAADSGTGSNFGIFGVQPQRNWRAAQNASIALISGHAGNDSGAVCADDNGDITLTEANVNAQVTMLAAQYLQSAGAHVAILDEYDARIDNLSADLLLSIHADSCIDASGFKAAHYTFTQTPADDARLVACIEQHYGAATGLPIHSNTVTHNMTEYHAFRKVGVDTPAAILELGFLGGDRVLLEQHPDVAARGIADAIACFLANEDLTAASQ